MIPKSLSATSIQVFELCPDRWKVEQMDRSRGYSTSAATTGSAVHGGLENYVDAVFIKKTHANLERGKLWELLKNFYTMSYIKEFNSPDLATYEYKDGLALTKRWFDRNGLAESIAASDMMCVESVELKEIIMVPFSHPDGTRGELPFNYIMDRVDQIGPTHWRVVDYKTIRVPLGPEDLWTKVQARAYALAIQIKHPEATVIEVVFDQLRHERIGLKFTKQNNIDFWHYLVSRTQQIIDLQEQDIVPVLNPECGYCPKKATCKVLIKNIEVGGIHSLSSDEKAVLYEDIVNKIKALNYLKDELGDELLRHAAKQETLEWSTGDGKADVKVSAPKTRSFDARLAAKIMGPELFSQVGKMNLGELDKIIKDESLPVDMRERLAGIIVTETGSLRLKVSQNKAL